MLPADMNLNERKTVQVYDDFMFSVRLLEKVFLGFLGVFLAAS
jgi:hypothetical protein